MTTKFIDVTGKTEDEAVASALAQLGLDRDEVSVEILERAKKGFLGIGASPAKVRVTYEAEVIFSFSRMRSLIMAMNSELVGLPLVLDTV